MDVQPLGGLLRDFAAVPDPRRFNVSHTLPQLLTCTLLAVLCRCDDYEEIAGWTPARHAWLVEVPGLPADRSPCRRTFERLFRRLDPQALQRRLIELTARLAEASAGRLIAIAGQTLRGSLDQAHRQLPIHRVHAWDRANGLMLGQVAVDGKSNEITAVAEPDNTHGRLDERTTWASGDVAWLRRRHADWPDLAGIGCVEGKRLDFATGRQSVTRRYCLTSLDPKRVGAAHLGELVRGHWSIENELHGCLGVSFADDAARVRQAMGRSTSPPSNVMCWAW